MLTHWPSSGVEDSVQLSWKVLSRFSVVLSDASPKQKWGNFTETRDTHHQRMCGLPPGIGTTQAEQQHAAADIRQGVRVV